MPTCPIFAGLLTVKIIKQFKTGIVQRQFQGGGTTTNLSVQIDTDHISTNAQQKPPHCVSLGKQSVLLMDNQLLYVQLFPDTGDIFYRDQYCLYQGCGTQASECSIPGPRLQ